MRQPITHLEALEGNHLGRPMPMHEHEPCRGRLLLLDEGTDRDLHHGRIRQRTILVYRCEQCDERVVLAHTDNVELADRPTNLGGEHVSTDLAWELVNSYTRAANQAHGYVRQLAAQFAVPGGEPVKSS